MVVVVVVVVVIIIVRRRIVAVMVRIVRRLRIVTIGACLIRRKREDRNLSASARTWKLRTQKHRFWSHVRTVTGKSQGPRFLSTKVPALRVVEVAPFLETHGLDLKLAGTKLSRLPG